MLVIALNLRHTLGDFIETAIFSRTVADRLDARLVLYYREDAPWKRHVLSLLQGDNIFLPVPAEIEGPPLDWLDDSGGAKMPIPAWWSANGLKSPDLVITPSMCHRQYLPGLGDLATFAVPHKHAVDAQGAIVAHWREAGYGHRPSQPEREIPVEYAQTVINHLVDRGEKVIRIGHPEMADIDGLHLDLRDAGVLAQAYAVSQAKLMLELSPSGPAALALGYKTPWLRCNSLVPDGPVETHSLTAMQHVDSPEGEISTWNFVDGGCLERKWKAVEKVGWSWRKMPVAQNRLGHGLQTNHRRQQNLAPAHRR